MNVDHKTYDLIHPLPLPTPTNLEPTQLLSQIVLEHSTFTPILNSFKNPSQGGGLVYQKIFVFFIGYFTLSIFVCFILKYQSLSHCPCPPLLQTKVLSDLCSGEGGMNVHCRVQAPQRVVIPTMGPRQHQHTGQKQHRQDQLAPQQHVIGRVQCPLKAEHDW